MERKIITFGDYFEIFLKKLSAPERKKLDYILDVVATEDRIPTKFVKYIRESLYEIRMEFESNIYRVFFIFDDGRLVVLFNGFQKKTQKPPKREIEKALKIKEEYYASKQ